MKNKSPKKTIGKGQVNILTLCTNVHGYVLILYQYAQKTACNQQSHLSFVCDIRSVRKNNAYRTVSTGMYKKLEVLLR